MAIFKPGPLAQQISGSCGAVTFARSNGRGVIRLRPHKLTASSPAALLARARFTKAMRAWADLSDYHRAQWLAFAPSFRLHDRLGVPYTPSPRRLFQWFASWYCTRTGTFYSSPPTLGRYPPPSILSLAFTAGGPYNLTMTMSPNFAVGGYFLDGLTGKSETRLPSRSPLYFKSGVFVNGVPLNVYSSWIAKLPPLVSGERFALRLWGWTLNYAPSFPQTISAVCT